MNKAHDGSCHCGAVKYRVTLDLAAGSAKCNCTFCAKTRNWGVRADPAGFSLSSGQDALGDYGRSWDSGNIHPRFCRHCGTALYSHGTIAEMGGDYLLLRIATLDGVEVDELVAGSVRYMDGLHDDWLNPPQEVRHL